MKDTICIALRMLRSNAFNENLHTENGLTLMMHKSMLIGLKMDSLCKNASIFKRRQFCIEEQ